MTLCKTCKLFGKEREATNETNAGDPLCDDCFEGYLDGLDAMDMIE